MTYRRGPLVAAGSRAVKAWEQSRKIADSALCNPEISGLTHKQTDQIFIPGRGRNYKEARSFCAKCAIQSLCLARALYTEGSIKSGRTQGFVGGKTSEERRRLLEDHEALTTLEQAVKNTIDSILGTTQKY